jgi:type I restriction enzyme S subunit
MCVRGTTGVVSIASSELVGCNTTRGITPIALGEEVSLWFVYHLLKMSSFQQLIASLTYGIALKQINMKDVRTLPIILPPLSLQQSFAAKVSAIEAQKQAVQQSIREVEALLAERMDNYFS